MERKEFLKFRTAAAPNHVAEVKRRTSTGLTKYAGTWGKSEVKHLLSRTLFGYTKADYDSFLTKGMDTSITDLLNVSTTAPAPPLNNYASGTTDPNVPFGQTWVNAPLDVNYNFFRRQSFKSWWAGLLINQSSTILEKMTLFWHNHFATQMETVDDSRLIYTHHAMLRANALGNFKTLVRNVTVDGAMLVYLNGTYNTKNAPDENYGRELQELFCVGKGPDSQYSEDDVKAAAHVLTGWKVNRGVNPATITFDVTKHDTGDKQFSSFYGNTKITGRNTSNAGDLELDDMLIMIFSHNEVAKFLCRKLYRYFVYYDIDANTETDIITPLADLLRTSNYDIKPVLQKLLQSEHFFDMANRGCYIKTPLEHLIGYCRQTKPVFPTASNGINVQYDHWALIYYYAMVLGMDIGDPPNVAGWQAFYQAPQYHEIWINSDSLPKRNQFTDFILYAGYDKDSYNTKVNVFDLADMFSAPSDPNKLIADALDFMLPLDSSASLKAYIKNILLPGGIPDYNWTNAWNTWKSTPSDTTNKNTVLYMLVTMFKAIMNLEEYQLS